MRDADAVVGGDLSQESSIRTNRRDLFIRELPLVQAYVFATRERLKMSRVNAVLLLAEMVEVVALGNRTNETTIDGDMGRLVVAVDSDAAML